MNSSLHDPLQFKLKSGKSGRDDYADKYNSQLDFQIKWLQFGAVHKVNAIDALLHKNELLPLNNAVELGCGTGAVISEFKRRHPSVACYGVDYAAAAIDSLNQHFPEIQGKAADITVTPNPFNLDNIDLLISSHVLEHLEEPQTFLQALHNLPFQYFIAEVPLENLLLGKLKSHFISRVDNASGHVQFFNPSTFNTLLTSNGLEIIDSHLYAPILSKEALDFAYKNSSPSTYWKKNLTERLLPKWFTLPFKHLYHAHYAVLCKLKGK